MWESELGCMQRKQPVCRPELQKNSDEVQETKRSKYGQSEAYVYFMCGIQWLLSDLQTHSI